MFYKIVLTVLIGFDVCNTSTVEYLNSFNCRDCNCFHPKDNSHYVRKISKCIFFPDGEKNLIMEDLRRKKDPPSMALAQPIEKFYIFTKYAQEVMEHNEDSIRSTLERIGRVDATYVIVHGFHTTSPPLWVKAWKMGYSIIEKLLAHAPDKIAILIPDWSQAADRPFVNSLQNVQATGKQLGDFLQMYINNIGDDEGEDQDVKLHFIGLNLGSHVATYAARILEGVNSITVLDPTAPLWYEKPEILLNENDAECVKHFITDAYKLGISQPLGQTNIYFSKGMHPQPRCDTSACSHQRAIEYFSVLWEFPIEITKCNNYKTAIDGTCAGSTWNYTNFFCPKGVFSARMDPAYLMRLYTN